MNSSLLHNFLTFKQGYNRGLGKAPHKPILMLAVIEAIERDVINDNIIPISPELVSLFKSYWDSIVITNHIANFSLPFFHLKNEKRSNIWQLIEKPGFKDIITSSKSVKSFKALTDAVYFAKLNSEFYNYLLDKENREIAKEQILNRYFNLSNYELTTNYFDKYESEMINDNPELYKAKIRKKIIEAKEEYVEESYIRLEIFKKNIPLIYSNTCAITGLHITSNNNISMIDACHIVPFAEAHDCTVGNGIALCPNMHRAFDRGLLSINENYRVIIANNFHEKDSSYSISQFDKKQILLPSEKRFYPRQENLDVHRKQFGFS